jgi:hypothetical protein
MLWRCAIVQPRSARSTGPRVFTSNGVEVPFDEQTSASLQEFPRWREQPQLLRRRFREQGYLLLRGALDRESVLGLRADYFRRFDASLLAAGTTPREGVFSGVMPPDLPEYGTAGHPAYEFVRSKHFDAFSHDPQLQKIAETLLGGRAQLLPRRIVRHFQRSTARASRAHVDYDYLDYGGDQLVTAWIPLGDCPTVCGGLVYLEGSHTIPRQQLDQLREHTDRPRDRRPVSNDLGMTARVLGGRWLWADYHAGDVVFHSPYTVHASLDNTSDVMRLSADVRFLRADATRDERWSSDWSADDGY